VELQYAFPHSEGFQLGSVASACLAVVDDVFPFWALSGVFLQNGPYVMVVQLIRSQSGWIPASYGYSCNDSYTLDA
jgi:hypothetical protein